MRIKSERDLFAGLLFVALGIVFAWHATTLRIGSAQRMGPGYFPLALGVLLGVIGAFIIFGALVVETEDGEPVGGWAMRPLVCVLGANLLFGSLLEGVPAMGLPPMGMVIATAALVFVCALAAGPAYRVKEAVVLSAVLALASSLALVLLLPQPWALWPVFPAG